MEPRWGWPMGGSAGRSRARPGYSRLEGDTMSETRRKSEEFDKDKTSHRTDYVSQSDRLLASAGVSRVSVFSDHVGPKNSEDSFHSELM